jgi:hypothetical protein
MPERIVNTEKYGLVIYKADLATLMALNNRQPAFLARSKFIV